MTRRLFLVAVSMALASCSLKHDAAPALAGPSTTALSFALSVTPDVITWDGVSQATVSVTAYGPDGQPMRSPLSLRAQTEVGGVPADFGRLSSTTASTDNNGHATFVYTAPPQPAATATSGQSVTIRVTPVQDNAQNDLRGDTVAIALALPSTINPGPPQGVPVAKFAFSPTSPRENDTIIFDASASTAGSSAAGGGSIVSYNWTFGDGGTGTGVRPNYQYSLTGTYLVTLTVTDNRGQSATTTQTVTIAPGADPTVVINVSPKSPIAGQAVNFSAAGSKASNGHSINNYDWDFGDGSHGSGLNVSHVFAKSAGYTVILTITDDQGRTATGTADVAVASSGPTAAFTNTSGSLTVSFNASGSTAIEGRTITTYSWDFGDGSSATGVSPSHPFAAEGPYTVTLKVTDSAGQTGTLVRQVTVKITPQQ